MMEARHQRKRGRAVPANSRPRKHLRTSDLDGHYAPIDELAWQEVTMPDRLDDVEGFMGMEEVEGIFISKTDDGSLKYKVCYNTRRVKVWTY